MTVGNRTNHPSLFTPELAELICERLADGMSLKAICRMDDINLSEGCVRRWARKDIGGFKAMYDQARRDQMDTYADELLDIADDQEGDFGGGDSGSF